MDSNYTNASNPYLKSSVGQNDLYPISDGFIFQNIYVTVICACIFTTAVHALLLVVLKRCRKMPTALNWLSFNFVACNMIHYIATATTTILFLSLDTAYSRAVFDLRLIMAAATYCVGCGMTAGLALERYIKLTYPYKFRRILSNLNVMIYIISNWVISIGVPLGIVGQHFVMTCKSTLWLCDFSGVIIKLVSFCIVVILMFTALTSWTVCIIRKQINKQIIKIAKSTQVQPFNIETTTMENMPNNTNTSVTEQRSADIPCDTTKRDSVIYTILNDNRLIHANYENETTDISDEHRDTISDRIENLPDIIASMSSKSEQKYKVEGVQRITSKSHKNTSKDIIRNNNFRATHTTLRIIISYVIVQVLITSSTAFVESYADLQSPTIKASVQVFCFTCTLVGSYLALYLYIWKFRECKMLFLIIFCSWNSRLYKQGNQLKFDIYNIVTTTDIRGNKRVSSP